MATHDLVIRCGSVVDGTGNGTRTADAAHTICAGQEIYHNGVSTGALPGRLIRHAG